MNDWPHFSREELECPCCHLLLVSEEFMYKLEVLRVKYGKKMHVNSACRCQKHNDSLPGSAKDSEHVANKKLGKKTLAIDIGKITPKDKWWLSVCAYEVGFHRVIVYKNFIHIGDDKTKPGGMLKGAY